MEGRWENHKNNNNHNSNNKFENYVNSHRREKKFDFPSTEYVTAFKFQICLIDGTAKFLVLAD